MLEAPACVYAGDSPDLRRVQCLLLNVVDPRYGRADREIRPRRVRETGTQRIIVPSGVADEVQH